MAFGNLFKSTKEIEREQRRAHRKALRGMERAVDTVTEKVSSLKEDRDKAWAEARNYLRDGQKAAAQRSLQTVQANEMLIGQMERKCWVFKQYQTKMELAGTDMAFADALNQVKATLNIDPEKIADTLDNVNEIFADQADIDKIWEKEYAKEMKGLTMSDAVPSMEEMMANLEKEVVAEVSGGQISAKKTSTANKTKSGSLSEAIGEGRRKLKDLMEKK